MEQDAVAALGVGGRELAVLRLVLLDPHARSLAEYADCCGLSIADTAAAATHLADLGLITWRKHEGWTDLMMLTLPRDSWKDEPFRPGCGVAWTHFTMRAWLAEVSELNGPDGQKRRRIEPLEGMQDLIWLDP